MGYNTSIYATQPIQLDGVIMYEDGHSYIRDRKNTKFRNAKRAWGKLALEPGTYLTEMHFEPATKTTSNYIVKAARSLSSDDLKRVNAVLYTMMLERTHAGLGITSDPIFLEARAWLRNEEPATEALRRTCARIHETLLEQYGETGVEPRQLRFYASRSSVTFSDILNGTDGESRFVPIHLEYLING